MGLASESATVKETRNEGYDIIINNLEPNLRRFIAEHLLLGNFGEGWRGQIPESVVSGAAFRSRDPKILQNSSVEEFLEGVYFLNLKDIMVAFNNYQLAGPFVGSLSKQRFVEVMNRLNLHRRKIAHAKANFSVIDLEDLIHLMRQLCQGEQAKDMIAYLDNKKYADSIEVPADFYEEFESKNNLPSENYDLDGGFVGREREIEEIVKLLESDQDRIVTITGAGGVGKTAIALKIAYQFLRDSNNPYDCILWFSAKTTILTAEGILPLTPEISGAQELLSGILGVIDERTAKDFIEAKVPYDSYRTYLYSQFSALKCLVIIDNLETIINNTQLIEFVKNVPRPSQVLITSRKGLGELERRYAISDMLEKDAMVLFRLVSGRRGRQDLQTLPDGRVKQLVNSVRCYPLLIKWSIGQVCLGRELDTAFSEIHIGGSEIAKFAFEDVFKLFPPNSRSVLYTMIIWGNTPISRHPLMQITNLDEGELDEAIYDLVIASFVFNENRETEGGLVTEYSMLTLTRGFVESKMDQDSEAKNILQTRYYHWREQARQGEQAISSYFQQGMSYGLRTPEDYAAFTYVKTAKIAAYKEDWDEARRNFDLALKSSPRLPYALIQYSMYERDRMHDEKALELAKRATESDPESYFAWFNLGLTYLRQEKPSQAIDPLLRAKKLNPSHLPIYNELGRAYAHCDQHDKAEVEFQLALKEEKYPNNRHRVITMQFMAENYRRWAQEFYNRKDPIGQLEKLSKAYEVISKAVEVPVADKLVWGVYRQVCIDYGIALWRSKGIGEGKPMLERALVVVSLGGSRTSAPDNKTMSVANYYLAALSSNEPSKDRSKIASYIGDGLAAAEPGSAIYDKLVKLKNEILGPAVTAGRRMYGVVRFYDLRRSLGVIESGSQSYHFKESNFKTRPTQMTLSTLKGRNVSFVLRKSPGNQQTSSVADIVVER